MHCLMPLAAAVLAAASLHAQASKGGAENAVSAALRNLRNVPDSERGAVTKRLALQIRELPMEAGRLSLARQLASRATEGDFGHGVLQEVAATLAAALRDKRSGADLGAFAELASLVRYEHVDASLDLPQFREAMAQLEAEDQRRQDANFTLPDLRGASWTLKDLRGKVVLVNFWATWCPPCRKEMPDLEALYNRFHDRGLVILAISDEPAEKVAPFIAEHKFSYPILLDSGRKVNDLFAVRGIPKTFLYDRQGRLAAQAIDMRTMPQFLALLDRTGMR